MYIYMFMTKPAKSLLYSRASYTIS